MPSLYSLLRKGKRLFPKLEKDITRESWNSLNAVALNQSRPPHCILVNTQSVVEDFFVDRVAQLSNADIGANRIPLVTPPFPSMWMEFTLKNPTKSNELKMAVQCIRNPEPPEGHACELYYWCEMDGSIAGPYSVDAFLVGEDGSIL